MKKIVKSLLLAGALFASATSAFAGRFFEMGFNLPVGISNNLISVGDILTDQIVIDLPKIANDMSSKGFVLNANFNPSASVKVDARIAEVTVRGGLDGNVTFNIGNGLFDLLGKGYKVGETLDAQIGGSADAFAYGEVTAGFKVGKMKFKVTPTMFVPVFHVGPTADSGFKFTNKENGDIQVALKALYDINTCVDISDPFSELSSTIDNKGFDLTGYFEMPMPILGFINLNAKARIPLKPGRLTYKSTMGVSMYTTDKNGNRQDNMTVNAADLINGDGIPTPEFDVMLQPTSKPYEMKIARPMKFTVGATADFLGFIKAEAGLGLGIKYPNIAELRSAFPEYYLGGEVSFLNLVGASVRVSYEDEIFTNVFGVRFNVRILEIDAGFSTQSKSFLNAFNASGIGFYIAGYVGF